MKYDKAYSTLLGESLSIYEIRELNFDESVDYNSDEDSFFCPDAECRFQKRDDSVLTTVNANKVKYKKTPHFKDTPGTVHRKFCPYGPKQNAVLYVEAQTTKNEGIKATDYPTEFLPERKKYTKKTNPSVDGDLTESEAVERTKPSSKTRSKSAGVSQNRTSVFEHIVECFLSNQENKDRLKAMTLTISGLTANYNFYFKKIRYFEDREGLIYWGKIKTIKDYEHSFAIIFEDRVSNISISAYINKAALDNYRKRKYFTEKVRSLIFEKDDVNCFFFGSYPELKKIKHGENEFNVYNIDISNLDHFLLRVID